MTMTSLETLRERLPEALRDLKLNLQTVTAPGTLGPAQRLGVALSAAAAARHPELRRALVDLTEREVGRPARSRRGAHVLHDPVDPRRQPRFAAEVGQPAVHLEEDLLRKVVDA